MLDGIFCKACKEVVAIKPDGPHIEQETPAKQRETQEDGQTTTGHCKSFAEVRPEKPPQRRDTSNINKGVSGEGSAGIPEKWCFDDNKQETTKSLNIRHENSELRIQNG